MQYILFYNKLPNTWDNYQKTLAEIKNNKIKINNEFDVINGIIENQMGLIKNNNNNNGKIDKETREACIDIILK